MEKTNWKFDTQTIEEYLDPRSMAPDDRAKLALELRDLLVRIYQEGYGWDKTPMENFFTERYIDGLALDSDLLLVARENGTAIGFASSALVGTEDPIQVYKSTNVFHTVPARESLAVQFGVRMLLRGILSYWERPGKAGRPVPSATRTHNAVVALYFFRFVSDVFPAFEGEALPAEYRQRYDRLAEYFDEEIDAQGIIHNSPVPLKRLPPYKTDGVSQRSAVVHALASIDRMDGIVFTGDQVVSDQLLNFARYAMREHPPSLAEIDRIAAMRA